MKITEHIAKNLREVYLGGNWTFSNFKDQLSDVSWQEANQKVGSFNTIITLAYHINYFVLAVTQVLKGGPLDSKDKFSFDHPPIQSQEDWDAFRDQLWKDAESFAQLIEELPDSILTEDFVDGKYGSYYRNLAGIIEHTHYHLGQIALIKKQIKKA